MTLKLLKHVFAMTAGILAVSIAAAQTPGLESYSVVSPFGLATATLARSMGMGGMQATVHDKGFANPAFAALQTEQTVGFRWTATEFENDMDVDSKHLWYVMPIKENKKGIQLTFLTLNSSDGFYPTPSGLAQFELDEQDLAIHYGQRITSHLSVGAGISAINKRRIQISDPRAGVLFNTEANSQMGGRLGLAYEFGKKRDNGRGNFFGVVYDYYQDDATAYGLMVPGGATEDFWNDQLAIGVSYNLNDSILLATEFQHASINNGDFSQSMNGWHVGGQYAFGNGATMQLGINDGHATAGFGFANDKWQAGYAYIRDWNDELVGPMFGTSDTHSMNVAYHW